MNSWRWIIHSTRRSPSPNHLEAGIRNACTELKPVARVLLWNLKLTQKDPSHNNNNNKKKQRNTTEESSSQSTPFRQKWEACIIKNQAGGNRLAPALWWLASVPNGNTSRSQTWTGVWNLLRAQMACILSPQLVRNTYQHTDRWGVMESSVVVCNLITKKKKQNPNLPKCLQGHVWRPSHAKTDADGFRPHRRQTTFPILCSHNFVTG